MKKRIIISLIVLLVSIASIVLSVVLFNQVPNVETFTTKESMVLAGAVMLALLGGTGIISFIVFIATDAVE